MSDTSTVQTVSIDPPPNRKPRVRLLPTEQAPLLARSYFADGDPGPMVSALAQVPELLEVAMPFIGKTLAPSSIPLRTKEIVILRTSAVLSCRYCTDAHTPAASDAGLARDEVAALRELPAGSEPDGVTFADPAERSLVSWIDAVAGGGPGPVPQPAADRLAAHFEDHEVVELTLLIGTTMLLNRFCTSLQLPTSPETLARLVEEGWT